MLCAYLNGELELRKRRDGSRRVEGRFPYNSTAVLSDGGRKGRPKKERFAPKAFNYRVARPQEQIHLLMGHDYGKPLASRQTGTLDLEDSDEALTFRATITPEIAATSYGIDALAQIDSGLAYGVSTGFRLPPERAERDVERIEDEEYDPARGMHRAIIRTIIAALLYELSVVTRPAYTESEIEARNWTINNGLALPTRRSAYTWR